jgi:hypothetical protein
MMTKRKPRYIVQCFDYTSEPMFLDAAEARLADITERGWCQLRHAIVPAEQVKHADD